MKRVIISILEPSVKRIVGEDVEVLVHEDGDFLDAIAKVDESYLKSSIKAKRGSNVINSILQLIWNSERNEIFDDVGIEARSEDNEWLPIKGNPFQALPAGSSVLVTPEAGC